MELNNLYNTINLILDASFAKVEKVMREITVQMSISDALTNRFITLMLGIGWPPPIELSNHQMDIIMKVYEKDKSKKVVTAIENILLEHYDEVNLSNKLNKWKEKPLLQMRWPILEQVIEAHINRKYWISIPGLLPQIEGIVAQGFNHKGRLYRNEYDQYLDVILLESFPDVEIDTHVRQFISNYLLKGFDHGFELSSEISRNAILHGYDTNYGTASNSLKAILCFDFVQAAFRFVSIKNGKTIHLVGCPAIYKKKDERELKFYKYFFQAENDSKIPCKICKPKERALL